MGVCLVTGSAGLIGSESIRFFARKGFKVVGIDNDMRRYFFGDEASTEWNRRRLAEEIPGYVHHNRDIRNQAEMESIFNEYGSDLAIVIHCAAQPSHDWAAKEPLTDFSVNAGATALLLDQVRKHAPNAVFVYTSTNKVYGNTPNRLPLVELETRYEVDQSHPYYTHGIDEQMSIDHCLHSLFGASKVAADVMVQEYGRYFGMKTVCFRGGCLTGPNHSGTQLHGFLAYLVKCALTGTPYQVFGYKGKQVRDNIHSLDLVNMFWHFYQNPRPGEAYNAGGSRHSNCSLLEAVGITERLTGKRMQLIHSDKPRIGDHQWWISDVRKFASHYPEWKYTYDIKAIIGEIVSGLGGRL